VDFLAVWIVPPLLGAVIGYITNWLAIKMLFRPLHEVRVLGLRVPLTPGLLPKERHRLARSIGDTVAAELLTEDVLRRRLSQPDLRDALAGGIAERLTGLLSRPAGPIVASLGSGGDGPSPLDELAGRAWSTIVGSEAFKFALAASARSALSAAEKVPLSAVLDPQGARDLAQAIVSGRAVAKVRERARTWLDRAYAGEGREGGKRDLLGIVPPEAVEPVLEVAVEGLYAAALPAVETFLSSPEVTASIEGYAVTILRRAIGRLNPIQRLIVSAAQYEKSIAETMPETVADMSEAAMAVLRGEGMARRAGTAAAEAFRGAAGASLASLVSGLLSRETAAAALDAALDAVEAHGPALAERAAALVADRADRSLADLVKGLGLPPEELAERAATSVAALLAGGGAAGPLLGGALSAFKDGLAQALSGRSLGETLGVDDGSGRRLAGWLADRALVLLAQEAGRIVAGMDIRKIVVERVDELDMLQAERLILDVVSKELTWITVLGGVLGGAIGLVQTLFLALRS